MNIHLLGLLGLIVLKVKLLELLKRVCERQGPIAAEGTSLPFITFLRAQTRRCAAYSMICVELAQEYVRLGKPKRAGALFNMCANTFKTVEVPDEVRLQYLLGHAEVLALGGNIVARYVPFDDVGRVVLTSLDVARGPIATHRI